MANSTPTTALATTTDTNEALAILSEERAFDLVQRKAKALAQSSLVPKDFVGSIPNCILAIELAHRLRCNPFMVMQNIAVIQGRPAFSAAFVISTINASGRFTPLRFRFTGKMGTDSWGCIASAQDKESGEICDGTEITIGMAKAEGWYSRNGSKWKTMPEQMLRYRAAAFFGRVYCPELLMGMTTAEEELDISRAPAQSFAQGRGSTTRSAIEAEIIEEPNGTEEVGREREGESQDFGVSDCSGARAVGDVDCSAPEGQHEEV